MKEALLEYFSQPPTVHPVAEAKDIEPKAAPFPSLNGFCASHNVTKAQIHAKVPKEVLQRCRVLQEVYLLVNLQAGLITHAARTQLEKNLIPVDDALTRENALNAPAPKAPTDGNSVELLKHVVADANLPLGVRMDAAEKLAPYQAPKLASVTQHIKSDDTELLAGVLERFKKFQAMKTIEHANG